MEEKATLLIVDDEPDMVALLYRSLSSEVPWEILTALSAGEAMKIMAARSIDLILLDIKMPEMDGMELLGRIKKQNRSPTVVMMTAYGVIDLAVESIRKGAYDFITKPFDNTRLSLTLKKAMEYHYLVNENKDLQRIIKGKDMFQEMIGTGAKMKEVFETIRMVSKTDATVLITGESGTGKELVAKAIHRLSLRQKGPFVAVNCPTLPENVLESELFGYIRGAFTDAKQDKKGLFQEADGGTIFLDEIGDLPGNLQTKLLRVLQEKEVKPLGSPKTSKVDVRVVASTNRNLNKRMAEGLFREDLFYRLNVVSIKLPPLRERREDIPFFVDLFLKRYTKKYCKENLKLTPATMDALYRDPWRGNVRELENAIKRTVIMSRAPVITLSNLPIEAKEASLAKKEINDLPYQEAKHQILMSFNQEYLNNLMNRYRGNVTHAAKSCGMERQSLQQLLRRYGIQAGAFRSAE